MSMKLNRIFAYLIGFLVIVQTYTNFYIGQVLLISGKFCPKDTLPAQGQLMEIKQFHGLFYVLGSQYGGDGETTFALPKLVAPSGTKYCLVVYGTYPTSSRLL
jgi:hypothetical protein